MTIQDFKRKYGSNIGIIVYHLLQLGVNAALKITDKDIQNSIDNAQKEDEKARAEGKIYLLDPKFVGQINEGARDLARLINDSTTKDNTYSLLALHLISEADYLNQVDFRTLQLEYWERIVKFNVESLDICDKDKTVLKETLEDGEAENIAWKVVNDDMVRDSINGSIDYELKKLLKENK